MGSGERRAVVEKKNDARTPREGLDVNVVSYKYEGMRQKEETNLILGDVEVEVGAGDLGLDVVPEPVHDVLDLERHCQTHDGRAVGDFRRVGRSSATGEEGNEFGEGTGDEGPRVSTPTERTRVVVVGVDGYFDRVQVAKDGVAALMRFEPCQTTVGGARGEAAFDDVM